MEHPDGALGRAVTEFRRAASRRMRPRYPSRGCGRTEHLVLSPVVGARRSNDRGSAPEDHRGRATDGLLSRASSAGPPAAPRVPHGARARGRSRRSAARPGAASARPARGRARVASHEPASTSHHRRGGRGHRAAPLVARTGSVALGAVRGDGDGGGHRSRAAARRLPRRRGHRGRVPHPGRGPGRLRRDAGARAARGGPRGVSAARRRGTGGPLRGLPSLLPLGNAPPARTLRRGRAGRRRGRWWDTQARTCASFAA